jgi:gamma-butyrobetaine dioxygenase
MAATTSSDGVTVTLDAVNRKLHLHWPENQSTEFHYVWLRHHARCPEGLPNDTSVKIDLVPDDPTSLVISDYTITDQSLEITWGDNDLKTTHPLSALVSVRYDQSSRKLRKPAPILWPLDTEPSIPSYPCSNLDDPASLLQIGLSIRDFGIARIINVPDVPGTVAEVAQRFGVVHRNNYGEVFDVKSNAYKALGSNTGKYLGPHTDESYRHAAPGITFFHCLIPSAGGGGASILVDGFNAAERLRNCAPDLFRTLTEVPVFFQRRALPEEDMQSHRRMITLDIDGEVEGIRFTDRTLPPQDLPDHLMEKTYQSIKAFWNIVNADDVKVEYPMESGDLHIFDNQRVLHGRTGFDPAQGERHLQQCSVNRDEFHNTLRTLAARLDHPAQMETMSGGAIG